MILSAGGIAVAGLVVAKVDASIAIDNIVAILVVCGGCLVGWCGLVGSGPVDGGGAVGWGGPVSNGDGNEGSGDDEELHVVVCGLVDLFQVMLEL